MKSLILYFYILFLSWKIVNCEENESGDDDFARQIKQSGFVDPYSFDYNRANKRMIDKPKFQQSEGICFSDNQCQNSLKKCRDELDNIEMDSVYTARWINLLLANARFKEDGGRLTGSVTLSGTKEEIEKLRGFRDRKIRLHEIDGILNSMITPTSNIVGEAFMLLDHLRITIYQYGTLTTTVLFTIAVLLLIKFVNWSTGKVVLVFLTSVFSSSFYMTWSQLIQEAYLRNMVEVMKNGEHPPIDCEPEKMSLWEKIVTHFHADDRCYEYYKAIQFNPSEQVTAIDALSKLLRTLMTSIAGTFGSSLSNLIENSTSHIFWWWRPFVEMMLYIFVFGTIAMLLFFKCGGAIRCWIPFCGIAIGDGQANQNRQQPIAAERSKPALTDDRERVQNVNFHLTLVLPEANSAGGLKQLTTDTMLRSTGDGSLVIGGGDSKIQELVTLPENCTAVSTTSQRGDSSDGPRLQENGDLVNETKKSDAKIEEKGDGDC